MSDEISDVTDEARGAESEVDHGAQDGLTDGIRYKIGSWSLMPNGRLTEPLDQEQNTYNV